MKKVFFIFFLLFCNVLFGKDPLYWSLYSKCRGPAQALLELLDELHVTHEGNWPSIVQATQRLWLCEQSQEKRELSHQISTLFNELHLTESLYADHGEYDYALVIGTSLPAYRDVLWHMKNEWERGIRFSKIVVLACNRPLSSGIESEDLLATSQYPFRSSWKFRGVLPKNEFEMAKVIFSQLDLPEEWDLLPVDFVEVCSPSGEPFGDIPDMKEWLNWSPNPGKLLLVSTQPYIARQELILRTMLHPFFTIDTSGPGISQVTTLPVLLRELTLLVCKINFFFN